MSWEQLQRIITGTSKKKYSQVDDHTTDREEKDEEGPEDLCGQGAVRVDDLDDGNQIQDEEQDTEKRSRVAHLRNVE